MGVGGLGPTFNGKFHYFFGGFPKGRVQKVEYKLVKFRLTQPAELELELGLG